MAKLFLFPRRSSTEEESAMIADSVGMSFVFHDFFSFYTWYLLVNAEAMGFFVW